MRFGWVLVAVLGWTMLVWNMLACTGCGREDDNVVVVESPEPDFSAAPGQVVITAKNRPSPRASAAAVPTATASTAAPGDGLVPFLPVIAPLATVSGQYQPLVRVELSVGAGKVLEDKMSPDGAGFARRFLKVRPGPYTMRVVSDLAPALPLVERQITVDGERSENLAVGAVTFSIPKEREDDLTRAIEVTLTAEPAKKVVLKTTLKAMETRGLVGELHPRTALLPFGAYSYTLADVSADPTLGFHGLPKGMPPVLTENTFELTEAHPVTLVNLEALVRTK